MRVSLSWTTFSVPVANGAAQVKSLSLRRAPSAPGPRGASAVLGARTARRRRILL